jgi:hypothetical protein
MYLLADSQTLSGHWIMVRKQPCSALVGVPSAPVVVSLLFGAIGRGGLESG